jgi:hypothetical protein
MKLNYILFVYTRTYLKAITLIYLGHNMCAPYAMHHTCDTQLDAAGWKASVNDMALDVGWKLNVKVEVGWEQMAEDG